MILLCSVLGFGFDKFADHVEVGTAITAAIVYFGMYTEYAVNMPKDGSCCHISLFVIMKKQILKNPWVS
jgi:hypothetical protein